MEGTQVEWALWNAGGTDDFEKHHHLCYLDCHIILICFAIDDPESFDNVQSKVLLQKISKVVEISGFQS